MLMADTRINFGAKIQGRAAELIIDKMAEVRKQKNIKVGASTATQWLLCELWNLKYGTENKKCD